MTSADGDDAGGEIRNAHHVIFSLCGALDHEVFPELSRQLEQTYLGLMQSLTRAQLRNDVDELQAIVDIIVDLRDTWVEAVRKVGGNPTGEE
jgi:flagellar biosynthetic protein FliS